MSFEAQKLKYIPPVNSQLINNDRLKNANTSINILLINILEENAEGLYRCSANNTHGVGVAEILFIGMTYCLWRVVLYSISDPHSVIQASVNLHSCIYTIYRTETPPPFRILPSFLLQSADTNAGLDNDNLKVSFSKSFFPEGLFCTVFQDPKDHANCSAFR
jgi:hypothetical protein